MSSNRVIRTSIILLAGKAWYSELLGTSVSSPLVLRRSSYAIIEEECNKGRADLCNMKGAQLLSATVGDLMTAELS